MRDGLTVPLSDGYGNTDIYFSAPFCDSVRFVYRAFSWGQRDTITPGSDPKFSGVLVDTDFYAAKAAIIKKYSDDVNNKLMELVPTQEAAEKAAENIGQYERQQIEYWKENDYTSEGRRAFYDGAAPVLRLCDFQDFSWDELITYLLEPEKAIAGTAANYLSSNLEKICSSWIRYNGITAKYEEIKSNPENEEHKRLKISRSIGEQKTVKIELANGHEVKAEAHAVKCIIYSGYISTYDVAAQDRQYLNQSKYNRPEDIQISDIVAIRHGGRVLYSA